MESFYILPIIQVKDFRFAQDFWHPFGKGTIGQTDFSNVLFKVSSGSKYVIYQGIYATTGLLPSVPVTANEASQLSELLGETKRKLDQCAKSRSSVEDALGAAQKLYQYVEELCRPNFSQLTA
ncbi:MAG: hypothetical protein ACHQ03_09610 [Candidatus Bathyarchaeia archaeon]